MSGTITSSDEMISGTVYAGETITGGTVAFDQDLDVLSGGEIINTNAGFADAITIESGGIAVGTTFEAVRRSDSNLIVYAGGTVSQTSFEEFSDGEQIDGGVASGSTFRRKRLLHARPQRPGSFSLCTSNLFVP